MIRRNSPVGPQGPVGPGMSPARSKDTVLDRGLELLAPVPGLDRLYPRIATIVGRARVILTLAAARGDPAYRRAQRVALCLARLSGGAILLVDRSQETLADTPHHEGPFTPDEARQLERDHLAAFLDAAAFAGVDVAVWVPSLPLLESYYEERELQRRRPCRPAGSGGTTEAHRACDRKMHRRDGKESGSGHPGSAGVERWQACLAVTATFDEGLAHSEALEHA